MEVQASLPGNSTQAFQFGHVLSVDSLSKVFPLFSFVVVGVFFVTMFLHCVLRLVERRELTVVTKLQDTAKARRCRADSSAKSYVNASSSLTTGKNLFR